MTFLGHIIPVTNPYIINHCYEFARINNFHVEIILNGIAKQNISLNGQGGTPAFLVYYSASEISFNAFFGVSYDPAMAPKIPALIHEIEVQKIENDNK